MSDAHVDENVLIAPAWKPDAGNLKEMCRIFFMVLIESETKKLYNTANASKRGQAKPLICTRCLKDRR